MSQDNIADALNMLWNAKKANKKIVKVKIISNLLIEVLKIMKRKGSIKSYKIIVYMGFFNFNLCDIFAGVTRGRSYKRHSTTIWNGTNCTSFHLVISLACIKRYSKR